MKKKTLLTFVIVLMAAISLMALGCDNEEAEENGEECGEITCGENASCENDTETEESACVCDEDFVDDGAGTCIADVCVDFTCEENEICEPDADGLAACVCAEGYEDDGAGVCVEVETDPCAGVTCDANEHCEADTEGATECVCDEGFEDDGAGTCVAIS